MSLQSAIAAHEQLLLANIEYSITEIIHEDTHKLKKIEQLVDELISRSDHIYFIHPVIVVESQLWEFTDRNDLEELKYFRLNIQKLFEGPFWVDIVNFKHLDEYFEKTSDYVSFHEKKKFKVG